MTGPVPSAWQRVLLGGVAANLVGTAARLVAPDADLLVGLPLYAWMVLPGAGYVRTWSAVEAAPPRYLLAAVLSLAGALLYAVASVSPAGGGRSASSPSWRPGTFRPPPAGSCGTISRDVVDGGLAI